MANKSNSYCLLSAIFDRPSFWTVWVNIATIITIDIIPALITVIANGILIITIIKTRTLHTPSNVIVGALCVTDFLVGTVTQPLFLTLLSYILTGQDLTSFAPVLWYSVKILASISFTYMFHINVDRYLAICRPLRYRQLATCRRYLYLVTTTFIIVAVIPSFGATIYFMLSTFAIVAMLPVMGYCYCRIFLAIRRQSRVITIEAISVVGQQVNHRKHRSTYHAFTLLITCGCFFVCYVPILAVYITNNHKLDICNFSRRKLIFFFWAEFLVLLNSFLNPIVYCFRLKAVRSAARQYFENMVCNRMSDS